jgi:murein L,D-transpeptidase YafK
LGRRAFALTLATLFPALPILFAESGPRGCSQADRVVILKQEHVLKLMCAGRVLKEYRVALGRGGEGPKVREGDGRTPEGDYIVDKKISQSRFHLALHLSYPNGQDRERAAKLGVSPGGSIEIHGLRNGLGWLGNLHRLVDWTNGCIAVTNPEIEEIWKLVPVNTPVEILTK